MHTNAQDFVQVILVTKDQTKILKTCSLYYAQMNRTQEAAHPGKNCPNNATEADTPQSRHILQPEKHCHPEQNQLESGQYSLHTTPELPTFVGLDFGVKNHKTAATSLLARC